MASPTQRRTSSLVVVSARLLGERTHSPLLGCNQNMFIRVSQMTLSINVSYGRFEMSLIPI